jgi:hypothetical protein
LIEEVTHWSISKFRPGTDVVGTLQSVWTVLKSTKPVAITAATAREPKNKAVLVEEPLLPNQWVSAWVNSLGTGSFHVVDDEGVTEGSRLVL